MKFSLLFRSLTAAVEQEAEKRPEVLLFMTHPGVEPITGLVYVLVIGTPDRFPCGKQLGSYTGLISCEDSSAGRQRLGHISKQGNTLLRYLLGKAAQAAARRNPDWRRRYVHLMMRREKKNCQSGHGQKTRCSVVLDVAETTGNIRSWLNTVRTWESWDSSMA
jgi:transposase